MENLEKIQLRSSQSKNLTVVDETVYLNKEMKTFESKVDQIVASIE